MLSSVLGIPALTLSNLSGFELLIAGALLLGVAAMLLALSGERRVSLKRSAAIDELAVYLDRMTEALDRISQDTSRMSREVLANRPADRPVERRTERKAETPADPQKTEPETRHVAYSMFGR